jgi:amino acid transporter
MTRFGKPGTMTEAASKAGTSLQFARSQLHQIGLLPLVFVFYAYTTAGPVAYEAIFSLSGPGMATLFLAFMPFFWSIPISLAAAEMNSMFPVQGGFYRWTRVAFGDFWGFQTGWWNWTGTFLLNSAYGVAFMDYVGPYVERHIKPLLAPYLGTAVLGATPVWKWAGAVAFLCLMGYANIRGVRVAGWVATALQIAVLLPVAVFSLWALLRWQHNPLSPLVPPGRPVVSVFGAGLALAMWNYAGY